jgi:hypothetical protein
MGCDAVGVQLGGCPGKAGARIVPNEHRPFFAECVHEAEDIGKLVAQAVALNILGCVRLADSTQVGRDGVVAGCGQCRELVAPRVPHLGKAMDHHHQRPVARLGDVHADPVGLDLPVANRRVIRGGCGLLSKGTGRR